jgi:hypothetical protein
LLIHRSFCQIHQKCGCENIATQKKTPGTSILKKPVSASEDFFWNRAYRVFCVILLCLTAGQLFFVFSDPHSGVDYRVYSGAVQALNHGEDPYNLLNINQYTREYLPFVYPPHTLFFFWCLQYLFIFQTVWTYYTALIALLVISGYVIVRLDKKPQYLFFITLVATGFMSMYWNFWLGAKDVLFLFLFACIFYLLIQEKFWQSSIIMGLMGSFSLATIPFIALFVVVRRSVMDRVKYIFLSISIVAALFLSDWLVNSPLLISYLERLGGSPGPIFAPYGSTTLTPFLMFGHLLNSTDSSITLLQVGVSLVYVSLILGGSWYFIRKNQENSLKVYSLAMLAIFMILPRIKPYDLIILALPLYFLFKDCSYKVKIFVFAVISLTPIFFWYYTFFHRYYLEIFKSGPQLSMISNYAQTISLFVIFALFLALEYYKPVSSPAVPDNKEIDGE